MKEFAVGALRKMTAQLDKNEQVNYQLPIGEQFIALNEVLGKSLTLNFHGAIHCLHCGKKTNKSIRQYLIYQHWIGTILIF